MKAFRILFSALLFAGLFCLQSNVSAQTASFVDSDCMTIEPSAIMYPECGYWIELAGPVEICWETVTRNIPGGKMLMTFTRTFKGRVYNSSGAEVAFKTTEKSIYLLNGNDLELLNEISVGSIGGMQILANHYLEVDHDGVVRPTIENIKLVCK